MKNKDTYICSKKYNIIYCDPPWSYKDKKNNDPAMGGITYPVMSLDDLKNLNIQNISEKDCVLCMWVTMPMLQEGLELIKSWGFDYKTCLFNWIKINPKAELIEKHIVGRKMPDINIIGGIYSGMGHWVNGNAELCLFAKKGSPKRLVKDVKQIQISPRAKHSEKPSYLKNEIVRLFGDLSRVELFAREKTEGWTSIGYDINGKDITESIKLLTQ